MLTDTKSTLQNSSVELHQTVEMVLLCFYCCYVFIVVGVFIAVGGAAGTSRAAYHLSGTTTLCSVPSMSGVYPASAGSSFLIHTNS
jgi:hypothetical protein